MRLCFKRLIIHFFINTFRIFYIKFHNRSIVFYLFSSKFFRICVLFISNGVYGAGFALKLSKFFNYEGLINKNKDQLKRVGRLDSELLDAWNLGGWTLALWILEARKFFPFLVTSVSILLLVNAEFLIISGTLRSMYYGSVERAANDCYNSIVLQLILQLIL